MSDSGGGPPTVDEHHISEKVHAHAAPHDLLAAVENGAIGDVDMVQNRLQRWTLRLEQLAGIEARGIERVPESIRPPTVRLMDYFQMFLIWFSANCNIVGMILGMLGPGVYEIGMTDGMLLGTFGTLLGSVAAGYISTFGPRSGNRTMVTSRYTMGWWPSRLCVILNIVIMGGYGFVDILISGQILTAVNGGGLTVIVGVIVSAIVSLIIVLFGIRVFHIYERYAWVPQLMILFILIGVAAPYWDTTLVTQGTPPVKNADRMSYFFLCVASPLGWAPASADFFVYFPSDAKRWKVCLATTLGLGISTIICNLIGFGLASGTFVKPSWATAYDTGAGALIVEAFRPLGAFGDVCSVILALGAIANNVPGTYAAALNCQLLGSWLMAIPRVFWTLVVVVVYTVIACAGRNALFEIFENFLALMGYWIAIWVTLTLQEEFLFRRRRAGYDWTAWNTPKLLPIGLAALAAFLVGWVGAILGMWQTYYTGPLGRLVGYGIDLGMPLGVSWSALVFPPLRWLELKHFGR